MTRAIRTLLSCLVLCGVVCHASASPHAASERSGVRYWPTHSGEVAVEIDGYGFDFETRRGTVGVVDGPWSHNGRYEIRKNLPGRLEMKIHFGTDARQRSDMDVRVRISRGTAVVTGTVHGKRIGRVSIPVRKTAGDFVLRFRPRGAQKDHVIRWSAR